MTAVSKYEGIELIERWANLMDAHASAQIVAGYTTADFTIQFGETRLVGLAGLEEHQKLKDDFFNERHLYYNFQVEAEPTARSRTDPKSDPVSQLQSSTGSPGSDSSLVLTSQMIWDTSRRRSDGGSEHLIADLRHRWRFVRHAESGRPLLQHHELIEMNYRTGFSPSESDTTKLHIDSNRVGFGQ